VQPEKQEKRMKPLIAIVIMFGVTSVYAGEAYKCVGTNGKAIFQNMPCGQEPKTPEQPKPCPPNQAEPSKCPPMVERRQAMERQLEQEIRAREEREKRLPR
jgi:hypothetical protein